MQHDVLFAHHFHDTGKGRQILMPERRQLGIVMFLFPNLREIHKVFVVVVPATRTGIAAFGQFHFFQQKL